MKRPVFIDADGQPYFEDARHDLRDRRGQLLSLEQENNIRMILRMIEASKAVKQARCTPTDAKIPQ